MGLGLCLWPVCHFLHINMEPIFLGQFLGSEGLLGLGQCERTVNVNVTINTTIQVYFTLPLPASHLYQKLQ